MLNRGPVKVVCPHCKVLNNVAPENPGQPLCGKCKQPLEPRAPGYPVAVTDSSFETEVVKAGLPVLLDLWGPSCPPCKRLNPLLKELAKELAGKVKVAKLNVEKNSVVPAGMKVRAVPTLAMFRGKEVGRVTGFQSLDALRAFVKTNS